MSADQPPPSFPPPPSSPDPAPPYGPPVPLPGMPPLATWSQRYWARLIDTLVLGVLWVLMLAGTGALEYTMDHPNKQDTPKVLLSAVLTFLLYFAYEGAMLARDGQTLGKKALRIRVAMLADGDVPGGQGWVRAAVYALPGILSPVVIGWVFWLISSLWQLWDKPFAQSLHDKAAKTVVVSAVR
ncbi:RDD family protein [Streptomyces sp. XD-27]|uniref:RDD family protein n=1 Tax=Streptomyces sp. XD-27 TaxID=3062779 RepID=UPI0026F43CD3|nr:RDD family protein [Streptomyces sp. XD-27]WKX70593.1 RDD family protein [Streptomyces sp. XD-27]